MGAQLDDITLKARHSEVSPSKRPLQPVPQPGDVLASARTARADVYAISIVPAAAHLTASRHSEAIEKVRELAGRLEVDGWARRSEIRPFAGRKVDHLRA
jgi:hypothetical protein